MNTGRTYKAAGSARVRFGLIGCGTIAYWAHLRSLRQLRGAELVAAADPSPAARKRAGRLTRVPMYEHQDDLLKRQDIDAVVISAPTHLHAELAIAAASASKHFYLEKPIATNALDACNVVNAADRAGVSGAVGFNRRFHPLCQQARALLASGHIGRVRMVQTAFCELTTPENMPDWKKRRATGGGVLLDLASHHIDLLRWFLEDEVAEIEASVGSQLTEQDTARIDLTMRQGVAVQSFFSFRAGQADFLEFIGENGTLRVDRHSPALALRLKRRFGYGVRTGWIPPTPSTAAWRLRRLISPSADPSYRRSLQAFVDRLQGRTTEGAGLLDGVRSLDAVLQAEASAARQPAATSPAQPLRDVCVSC